MGCEDGCEEDRAFFEMLHIGMSLATHACLDDTSFLQLADKLIDILDFTTTLPLGWVRHRDSLQPGAL